MDQPKQLSPSKTSACKIKDFAELGIQAPIRKEEEEKKKIGKNLKI